MTYITVCTIILLQIFYSYGIKGPAFMKILIQRPSVQIYLLKASLQFT